MLLTYVFRFRRCGTGLYCRLDVTLENDSLVEHRRCHYTVVADAYVQSGKSNVVNFEGSFNGRFESFESNISIPGTGIPRIFTINIFFSSLRLTHTHTWYCWILLVHHHDHDDCIELTNFISLPNTHA